MSQQDSQPLNSDATPEHDPDYQPLVQLTQVETKTHEENETVIFKLRAKLFRFDKPSSEWKERGTCEVKLLQDKTTSKVRLVMRRDKTLKVCANHFISSDMVLAPNIASDRSWVYNAAADVGDDGTVTAETLAIRFGNSENAQAFKLKFEEAQKINSELLKETTPTKDGEEKGTTKKDVATEESKIKKEEEGAEGAGKGDKKESATKTVEDNDTTSGVQPVVQTDASSDAIINSKTQDPSIENKSED